MVSINWKKKGWSKGRCGNSAVIRRVRVGKYTEVLGKCSTFKGLQEVHMAAILRRKEGMMKLMKMAGNPS